MSKIKLYRIKIYAILLKLLWNKKLLLFLALIAIFTIYLCYVDGITIFEHYPTHRVDDDGFKKYLMLEKGSRKYGLGPQLPPSEYIRKTTLYTINSKTGEIVGTTFYYDPLSKEWFPEGSPKKPPVIPRQDRFVRVRQ